jgi:hypothetical protein
MADLGFSHLYFSCKNYQELAQARIKKVVGYFTTNPEKLDLHFSDFPVIFYAIYKNQEITSTIGVHLLQGGPRKATGFCNVAPRGCRPARGRKIPVRLAGVWPGKG